MSTVGLILLASASAASAQAPAPDKPPLWDTQVGASFVGTSGNSDTTTVGADFALHRRWAAGQIESSGTAVRTTSNSVKTAERYVGSFRGDRKLSSILGLSAGERADRDRLAGIDVRSVLDGGLHWTLLRTSRYELAAITSVGWEHESLSVGPDVNHPVGLLQVNGKVPLGASADATGRFSYYPDFQTTSAYRTETEAAAQAAINSHLALKFGYLWQFTNQPVPGFKKNDGLATASLVLHWRSTATAP